MKKRSPWRGASWICTASIGLHSKVNARFVLWKAWSHRSKERRRKIANSSRIHGADSREKRQAEPSHPVCTLFTGVESCYHVGIARATAGATMTNGRIKGE